MLPRHRLPAPSAAPARATIDDVARAAGVSKATVSRHLNERSDLLTADISARVAAAMRSLDYRPSPAARGLKRGRSRLVGLVVADVTNPYSVAVLHGAEAAFRAAGYMVMLFNVGNDGAREREAVAALADYQVEGFIVHTPGGDAAALDAALRRDRPVVLVDRRAGVDAPFDLVGLDNAGAVALGVAHLLDAGWRHLLYVGEPATGISSREERLAAFDAETVRQAQARGASVESVADDPATLDAALRRWRKRARGAAACAVFSGNAVVTLRVAAAAARLGWPLGPGGIGLLGFDDTDWAPLVGPGLSAIAQPTDDIGRCAAACLLERMRGAALPARQVRLPGVLVARASTRLA